MKKLALLSIFSFFFSQCAFTQDETVDCTCCAEEYRQFDFWIGDWVVTDSTGKELGTNLIHSIQDGCGFQENWKSTKMTGTSYNFYNATDKSWNQLWIDNKGGSLELKGSLVNGKMILKSELFLVKK